jgi:anti-sigma28 factor (negative regulator of flagellin synthesis)
MKTPEIVSQLAQLLRQKEPTSRDTKQALKIRDDLFEPKDEVELSSAGAEYSNPVTNQTDFEKEQHMKVERLKTLVASGNYRLDEDIVESIASDIARMFV